MPKRKQKALRRELTEYASGSGIRPSLPLNAQQKKDMAILKEAERAGRKSMNTAGKRIRRGIREALKASESVG